MTIVIPSYDDILSGIELKFALRSIEKNLTGWTNLILVGHRPVWYKGESVYAPNDGSRKEFTIYSKFLVACDLDNVTDNFVMWNDDIYLLKPLDVANIDDWYDGYLKDSINGNHGSRYKEKIKKTLQIIPDTLNYNIHAPCIYNKEKFRKVFYHRTDEILIQSFYFSQCGSLRSKEMKDFKINQLLSKEAIKELIKDRMFLSTSTNGMKKPMIELLHELFPEPSKYE